MKPFCFLPGRDKANTAQRQSAGNVHSDAVIQMQCDLSQIIVILFVYVYPSNCFLYGNNSARDRRRCAFKAQRSQQKGATMM